MVTTPLRQRIAGKVDGEIKGRRLVSLAHSYLFTLSPPSLLLVTLFNIR